MTPKHCRPWHSDQSILGLRHRIHEALPGRTDVYRRRHRCTAVPFPGVRIRWRDRGLLCTGDAQRKRRRTRRSVRQARIPSQGDRQTADRSPALRGAAAWASGPLRSRAIRMQRISICPSAPSLRDTGNLPVSPDAFCQSSNWPLRAKSHMSEISWDDFQKVELRVGTITEVEEFPEARRPAWKLSVDWRRRRRKARFRADHRPVLR